MSKCPYCLRIDGIHHPRCPYYEPEKITYYCSICSEGIQNGEYYITNDDGRYAHWECIDYKDELADFLGYKKKIMVSE